MKSTLSLLLTSIIATSCVSAPAPALAWSLEEAMAKAEEWSMSHTAVGEVLECKKYSDKVSGCHVSVKREGHEILYGIVCDYRYCRQVFSKDVSQ